MLRSKLSGNENENAYYKNKMTEPLIKNKFITLEGHWGSVRSVAFSPDGQKIVSGSEYWSVGVWDVNSRLCTATLYGHMGAVMSVAFSPDGRRIASGGRDNRIKIWEFKEKLNQWKCIKTLNGGNSYYVYSVAFSPDGRNRIGVGVG
jgi:WD40 repeat protein